MQDLFHLWLQLAGHTQSAKPLSRLYIYLQHSNQIRIVYNFCILSLPSPAHRSVWVLLPSVYYMLASCLPLSSHVDFALGSKAQEVSCHTACTDCKKGFKQLSLSLFVRKCTNLSKTSIYTYMYVLHMICVLNFLHYSSDPPGSETKPLCRMCTSLSRERHVLSRAIINL